MTSTKAGYLFLVAALLIAASFSTGLIGNTPPQDGDDTYTFACINLSKVLYSHKGLAATEAEITEFLKNGEEELNRAQKELQNLRSQSIVYSEGSEEARKLKNDVELKELSIKQHQRDILLERDARSTGALVEAYKDIEKAVREYAKERGLKAVFDTSRRIEEMQSKRPEDFFRWFQAVNVAWSDDQLDISDAIITIINGS